MEREFIENERKLEAIKSSSYAYSSLSNLYDSYKELKEENERKESKNIEVLAIFVAIVTFTAGVIPGFRFIDSGIEAIFFTLALGLSMSAFGVTLFSISRNKSDWIKSLKHFSIFIGFSIILWWLAYGYFNDDFVKYREEQKKEKTIDEFHQDEKSLEKVDTLN